MAERVSEATWQGKLRDGHGFMKASSGAFQGPYSFGTRFGEAKGTNPEELLAAAHASCYAMALGATVEKMGFVPGSLHTPARVRIDPVDGGFRITQIHLRTEGDVPGMSTDDFRRAADEAFQSCPLSQVLRGGSAELHHETVLIERPRPSGEAGVPS